jgi:phage gp36-like protein
VPGPPTPITVYCSKDDVGRLGVTARALRGIPADDIDAAIVEASREIDSYLRAADYTLPLTAVGAQVKGVTAVIAAWTLIRNRVFNPDDPSYRVLESEYERRLEWLRSIRTGAVVPDVTDSAGAEEVVSPGGVGRMQSNEMRGWQQDSRDPSQPRGAFTGGRR